MLFYLFVRVSINLHDGAKKRTRSVLFLVSQSNAKCPRPVLPECGNRRFLVGSGAGQVHSASSARDERVRSDAFMALARELSRGAFIWAGRQAPQAGRQQHARHARRTPLLPWRGNWETQTGKQQLLPPRFF